MNKIAILPLKEMWEDIVGFEGLYQISNQGRIKSLSRFNSKTERILSHYYNVGYYHVRLYKLGVGKSYRLHRLIATHFISNLDNKPIVHHKNGNKLDNRISNLEWTTHKKNLQHAWEVGLNKGNEKPVNQIKDGIIVATFKSASEASRLTKINRGSISNCCKKRIGFKTAGGYYWKYKLGGKQ